MLVYYDQRINVLNVKKERFLAGRNSLEEDAHSRLIFFIKRHRKVLHEGVRPFARKECDKMYYGKRDFLRHMGKHVNTGCFKINDRLLFLKFLAYFSSVE